MEKLDMPCEKEMDYDLKEFVEPFLRDMRAAQRFIVFYGPFLNLQLLKIFLAEIRRCIARGVHVCFIILKPKTWDIPAELQDPVVRAENEELASIVKMLESHRCHVNMRNFIHLKVAIFDGILMYKGSLNFFSYGKSTDSTTRSTNPAKAMNTRKKYDIFCDKCLRKVASEKRVMTIVSRELAIAIGDVLAKFRTELKLGQRAMASIAGTKRSRLHRIENKTSSAPIEIVVSVCDATGRALIIVPKYCVGTINRLIETTPEPED